MAQPPAAQAANAADFDPGYIIDDGLFYNGSLMDENQIQSFLEARVPSCARTGSNPGCLKDYRADVSARAATAACGPLAGGSSMRASAIIKAVAVACNISPQALIVTLQKEQGLITATNPSANVYRIAMGYGCPDTAACDTAYYGFANQLYSAASQFQRYRLYPSSFRHRIGQNSLYLHPDSFRVSPARCGTASVTIKNAATVGLYNYTPYTPNAAALANLYGTGDSCSSYGNRNFWRFYTDWFGSTTISSQARAFVTSAYVDVLGRQPGAGEITSWGQAIMNGMPSGQVAGGFVNSDEFRLLKIDAAYREVLGREPEAAGRQGWLDGMRRGVVAPDDVARVFMVTDEYYNRSGGAVEPFVAAVYERIIKRPAVTEEIAYWSGMVATYGRATVVDLIWFSVETARARVADMYSAYLGRVPDYGGLVQWGDYALRNGDTATRSAIIGSSEYWIRASIRYPG
ncbi:DUF4214 domain-containing protein [Microcella daejeonensis]|uniref:DUF4214 domain-containing protein n=1 Tax=Microcella daejeonensis TaxID=2994971 RepID=UPI002270D268|nr:DUF4214 domain-containing protein [Microcella daejeonensis]WAB84023.1 DUF4214 domain-containing protein [Microcella daejeonensis]